MAHPRRPALRGLVALTLLAPLVTAGCTVATAGSGQRIAAPVTSPDPAPSAASPTGSSSPASSVPAPSPSVTSQEQAQAALSAAAPGAQALAVDVGLGFEGMTWAADGTVHFWSYAGGWQPVGTSTYPFDASSPSTPPTAVGAVLQGMSHATFLVHGVFSGDGSGNAVAYTDGPAGWGAIKAQPDANLAPSGQGVGFGAIGLLDDGSLDGGVLTTADCSVTLPIAQCGGDNRVIKVWRWDGAEFVLAGRAGLPQ